MEEIWVKIKNSKDYYVSNIGNVKSKYKTLKKCLNSNGYEIVNINVNNKRITKKVHRLVIQAFIPNPKQKRCVNHKDGCRTNNELSNLEWVTHSENNKHAYDNLNRSPVVNKGILNGFSKEIIDLETGFTHYSVQNLIDSYNLNISRTALTSKLNGQNNNNTKFLYI